MALALVFGAVLWPIGQIGSSFASLIHPGVNRQREFLADASAVHYTRDPQGLCEALVILLESEVGGRLRGPGAQLAGPLLPAPAPRGRDRGAAGAGAPPRGAAVVRR